MLSRLQFLRDRFRDEGHTKTAIIWHDQIFSYGWLIEAMDRWAAALAEQRIGAREIVSVTGDFSPNSTALMLALIELGCTVVPLTNTVANMRDEFLDTAQVTADVKLLPNDTATFTRFQRTPSHPLYEKLWHKNRPGLVLFSSGSTGKSKAVLHDFENILQKYKTPRQAKCTLAFLLFDHIGGVNTLLHVLSNGGTVVTVPDRSPATVCRAIESYKVQVLPTSPSFLNLLLLSGALEEFDLASLETITYGTEVMPESTLQRVQAMFPTVRLHQTYGLSEVGILRSKSESSSSLRIKIGGEGFDTRIVDGMLQIKSASLMLGYLNASSPITEDGWFMTGDLVEEHNGYYRIRGRKSELINIGGEKVFPSEIEDVLCQMDGVVDAIVSGEPHALLGNIVVVRVRLSTQESLAAFRKRMIIFCKVRLQAFKIPQKVLISSKDLHGQRFKKIRSAEI